MVMNKNRPNRIIRLRPRYVQYMKIKVTETFFQVRLVYIRYAQNCKRTLNITILNKRSLVHLFAFS